ncbi:hypothetical protein B0H11DRAFT_2006514, partial [Mycena galericulata]
MQTLRRTDRKRCQGKFPGVERLEMDIGDDRNDTEFFDDALPSANPLPSMTPHHAYFYQAVCQLCAWTAGPPSLLRSHITRSSMPINVSLADLPGGDVKTITSEELVAYWTQRGNWSSEIGTSALNRLKKDPPKKTDSEGACHCEAGLMASIVLQCRKPEDIANKEPPI